MSKSALRQQLLKEQEILSKIIDSDDYEINDTDGKKLKIKGSELKPYIISMRGQIDFTELTEEISKPVKPEVKATKPPVTTN